MACGTQAARVCGADPMTWPSDLPGGAVQRAVNAHAHLTLERSGNASIAAWQRLRLSELVDWLVKQVPWWRARLGPNFSLEDWPDLSELSRFALRNMAATHGPAPVPEHHGSVTSFYVAGPPGAPARYFTSAFSQVLVDHAFYADHRRQGRNPYALQACISEDIPAHDGTHIEVPASIESGTGVQVIRSMALFTKRAHMQWLHTLEPAYLTTPPAWLDAALDQALSDGAPLPEMRQVLTYGANVSNKLRSKVRQQLGASVRHRYTCLECGPLAFQCPRSDDYFHVAVGNALVEVVQDNGTIAEEGVQGRVLVTALHQYATPMLRHDIGDRAALHHHCPGCGLVAPALSQLVQSA